MAFMRGRFCPQCGGVEIYPSMRRNLKDKLLRLIAIRPYRCHDCNSTHHGFSGMKRIERHNVNA